MAFDFLDPRGWWGEDYESEAQNRMNLVKKNTKAPSLDKSAYSGDWATPWEQLAWGSLGAIATEAPQQAAGNSFYNSRAQQFTSPSNLASLFSKGGLFGDGIPGSTPAKTAEEMQAIRNSSADAAFADAMSKQKGNTSLTAVMDNAYNLWQNSIQTGQSPATQEMYKQRYEAAKASAAADAADIKARNTANADVEAVAQTARDNTNNGPAVAAYASGWDAYKKAYDAWVSSGQQGAAPDPAKYGLTSTVTG